MRGIAAFADDYGYTGAQLITVFIPLDEAVRYQYTMHPNLPVTLTAIADGVIAEIPVAWEAEGYNADAPDVGLYAFYASVGEGYTLAYDIELPKITVMLVSKGRMARATSAARIGRRLAYFTNSLSEATLTVTVRLLPDCI